jgi:hypothetical protein
VRKQYHFRPSDRGLLAWDIDRLIFLTEGQPVEDVPLDAIAEVHENWWFAFGSVPTVRRVVDHFRRIDEVDLAYPIIIDPDGRLMDGMHRVAKALGLGLTAISAKRLAVMPDPDFIGVAPADLPQ